MKPQPFNLDLWLHLGKPDCVWTKNGHKVLELKYHEKSTGGGNCAVLSGLVYDRPEYIELNTWSKTGRHTGEPSGMFSPYDLMLHLEDKPKTFGVRKR